MMMTARSFLRDSIALVVATVAGSRVALGTAAFGGMFSAAVVGTLPMPVMYDVVQGVPERVAGKLGGEPAQVPVERAP